MLDESIKSIDDIDRAATVPGVKFVKLKLKRIGGIDRAVAAMERARQVGLDICLGDGVATELLCWVEACTGRTFLRRAGDMNGFLKPVTRLFKEPLAFDAGSIVLKPGFWPELDLQAVKAHELRRERFAPVAVS
jgi:L-alanine-DL-glutamate epimerase-like enolase superfamily enzyme